MKGVGEQEALRKKKFFLKKMQITAVKEQQKRNFKCCLKGRQTYAYLSNRHDDDDDDDADDNTRHVYGVFLLTFFLCFMHGCVCVFV